MARTRQNKQRGATQKPTARWKPRKRWWKEGDKFTVEYIERAISVKVGENPWAWIYVTKWYLYSRGENTMESAGTFADCEYPILQRFWDSIGKAIPEGHVEPEPTGSGYEIFESTQTYRRREARLTLKFDCEDEAQEDVMDETPVETVESGDQSDTEVEALLAIDSMSIDEEEMPLPSTNERDLFLPASDPSDTTDSETSSDYEPELALVVPPTPPMKHVHNGSFSLPINGTVAPLDTVKNILKDPKLSLGSRKGFEFPGSSTVQYSALRPGNTTSGDSSIFTGRDFRSTPSISLRDRETMPFRRETGSSRGARRTPMNQNQRMKFYNEIYTKEVNKTLRKQLAELPPGMERAAWDRDVETGEADRLFDEFIAEPEPPLRTLQDFPVQDLDTSITF